MKHRFLTVGIIIGIFIYGVLLAMGLLSDQSDVIMWSVVSLLLGVMLAVVVYSLKPLLNRKMHQKIYELSADIHDDEKILIDGPAGLNSDKSCMGKLFLTRDNLLFKALDQKQLNYSIENISDIRLLKKWGVINNGLKFNYNGIEEMYYVDYAGDWKVIIEYVKGFNDKSMS
ncbi:hypothetical protein [Carboxylicivirga sp. RSCT41]|uniref:hypothetical protein n=1 Tax=Carboxylicivirga agarovorans TaxID=3417570 RepID=UPI003D338F1B